MLLKLNQFTGTIPRRSPRLLPPGAAQLAQNCLLTSGEIRPYRETLEVNTPFFGTSTKTIYLYKDSSAEYWFNWNSVVEVARGPLGNDTLNRLYWTDGTKPRKTGNDVGIPAGGGGELPDVSYFMGVLKPGGAPVISEQVAGAGETQLRSYVITYVTGWGEEGAPSAPREFTTREGATIRVTKFAETPATDYNITHWNIYRTNTGDAGTFYQFVSQQTIATLFADETVASDNLGVTLPTVTYDEPPADMRGLVVAANGVMAGFSGREVCFSEPYKPHAWPLDYRYTVPFDILNCGAVGVSVVIATKGQAYVFAGAHPSTMTQMRISDRQPCVSAQSVVEGANGVLYATADGLFFANSTGGELITRPVFTKPEWQALVPTTIIAAIHDGRYYGSFLVSSGGVRQIFIFDPAEPTNMMTTINKATEVLYSDLETDKLYMLLSGKIEQWDNATVAFLFFKWKSGVFHLLPSSFGAIQVDADYGPIQTTSDLAAFNQAQDETRLANIALIVDDANYAPMAIGVAAVGEIDVMGDDWLDSSLATAALLVKVFANGIEKDSITVKNEEPYRLKGGYQTSRLEIEIEGNLAVQEIRLAGSPAELASPL